MSDDLGVFVFGMHRSGTSAAARVINLLGVPLCDSRDLMPHLGGNPTGHWESSTLMQINERLLHRMGRSWASPPAVEDSPMAHAELFDEAVAARRAHRSLHPTSQWVWKDPRLALLLPYWLAILPVRAVSVLMLRHPLEVAMSLHARDGIPVERGLAIWERYLRHGLANCNGLPTCVASYSDLVTDTMGWVVALDAFLDAQGVHSAMNQAAVQEFIEPGLRHTALDGLHDAHSPLTPEQRELWACACELLGQHGSFCCRELPDESPGLDEQLGHSVDAAARGLSPAWRRWLAEASLGGVGDTDLVRLAGDAGADEDRVTSELAVMHDHPWFQAGRRIARRLAYLDDLLDGLERARLECSATAPAHAALPVCAPVRSGGFETAMTTYGAPEELSRCNDLPLGRGVWHRRMQPGTDGLILQAESDTVVFISGQDVAARLVSPFRSSVVFDRLDPIRRTADPQSLLDEISDVDGSDSIVLAAGDAIRLPFGWWIVAPASPGVVFTVFRRSGSPAR